MMMRVWKHPSVSTDRDDVRAAQSGDVEAWGRLVSRHGPRVYALCRRLDADPDDAYQAVWERIYTSLGRFDSGRAAPFGAWVHTLSRRLLIDRHRRSARHGEVIASIVPRSSVAPVAEAAILRRQRGVLLEDSLRQLPAGQRRVVVLHHIEGVSLEEIASQEGVAVGTVKSRLHRGRARLARILGASA